MTRIQARSQRTRIGLAVSVGALALALALPAPASAVDYTGWQTNSGWNSLSGCAVYREIRSNGVAATDGNICGGDVGVKGKFVNAGTVWITPWDWDYRLASWVDSGYTWKKEIRVAHE